MTNQHPEGLADAIRQAVKDAALSPRPNMREAECCARCEHGTDTKECRVSKPHVPTYPYLVCGAFGERKR